MKKVLQLFVVCLAAALVLPVVPAASGTAASFSGSGTSEDPYLIQSAADLVKLSEVVYNGQLGTADGDVAFLLTVDLDLSSVCGEGNNWQPIGKQSNSGQHKPFKCRFDGGNHTISNLYIDANGLSQGLFGEVSGEAVIRNLILDESCRVTSSGGDTGGLVGKVYGSGSVLFENIGIRARVDANLQAGGLFGLAYGKSGTEKIELTVRSCYVTGSVTGSQVGPIGTTSSYVSGETYIDCYYLEGCAKKKSNAAGNQLYVQSGVVARPETAFHSGQVAYELSNGWGQTIGADSYPDLTSPPVCFDAPRAAYYHPNRIYGVSPALGADLSLYVYAYLDDSHKDAILRTEWQEEVFELTPVAEGSGRYHYKFTQICPQCMTEPLNAELLLTGQSEPLDRLTDFRIVDYCAGRLARTESSTEKQLLVDLVEYGTAAQRYTGYRTADPANEDAGYLAAKQSASVSGGTGLPANAERVLSGSGNENGTRMRTIGLRYDYTNRLYLKLHIAETDRDKVSVDVAIGPGDSVRYGFADLVSEGEDSFRLETGPLSVRDFGKSVSFSLNVGDATVQQLVYGVNVWCYTVGKEGSSYPETSRLLAVATYRYGLAAEAYVSNPSGGKQ